jgi:imidazoleglycerol-phosphate dehydratase/histidinol-phosphatase
MNKKEVIEKDANLISSSGNGGQKLLFIDRDGTIIQEPPITNQLDTFAKLEFYPHVFEYLTKIVKELDYQLVMVTNQDGLGTDIFPEDSFWPLQNFVVKTFENEGIIFSEVLIDRTFPHENQSTRKPGTGMLKHYFDKEKYDLANSFVIGDRLTDVELAKNLGCHAFFINNFQELGTSEITVSHEELKEVIALETQSWEEIYNFLRLPQRTVAHSRNTNETKIGVSVNLDGSGKADI